MAAGEMSLALGRGMLNGNGYKPHALEARDLWFSYDGSSYVLEGVNLALDRGAVTMILGRSGSGKTTLLKIIAGLLAPQKGEVRFSGGQSENGHRRCSSLAYVPQTLGLVRNMTALENTLMGALTRIGTARSLLKLFPRSIVDEAKETLERLGLGRKIHQPVYNLSGGERQRVAIARSLMQKPSLILADEFVSQLDPVTSEEILVMMREIARQGVSFLVTTHETDVVTGYADYMVVMRQGHVLHCGNADDMTMGQMVDMLR